MLHDKLKEHCYEFSPKALFTVCLTEVQFLKEPSVVTNGLFINQELESVFKEQ